MKSREDRLGAMVETGATAKVAGADDGGAARPKRRRALLYAPPPAPSSAYLTLLENEGFDVVLARDAEAAEVLVRAAPPALILAVSPVLGPELVATWKGLAPRAEVRHIPGLATFLEEHIASPRTMLDFTLRSLLAAASWVCQRRGLAPERPRRVLDLVERAAETLALGESQRAAARVGTVLWEICEALNEGDVPSSSSAPSGQEADGERAATDLRAFVHSFAESVGCPFAMDGVEDPEVEGGPSLPGPERVVEAAREWVQGQERGVADLSLHLRRLASEPGPRLHAGAVEAVLGASREGVGGQRGEILLADADAGQRNLLSLRLTNEGYRVRGVGDGRRALEEVRARPPDLILMDTVLPGLDGYALLDAIKGEGHAKIPCIYLSSRADPLSVNKGLLLGAVDFLARPVNLEVLLTKLQRVLAQGIELSDVTARLSLSDVSHTGGQELPALRYDELATGVTIHGRFRIEADLGEGGMGRVFKAEDLRLEETVVIKVMKLDGREGGELERFKREIRLARKITHPGVVRIYDFWEAGALRFVTMEFLQGSDLRREMERRGAFPIPVALRVATEIFEALEAAHRVGVLHRDIKPHNVLMLPTGRIKVLDFGIARGFEASGVDTSTLTTAVVGTPEYMSPEQVLGERLDPRTDLYSSGVLLYELLSGRLPFEAETRLAALQKRLVSEPEPPSRHRGEIPEDVDRFVLALLRRDRAERDPSATAVIARLQDLRRRLVR